MPGLIRILDGGMSRELSRLGARLKQPEWSALALMESNDGVWSGEAADQVQRFCQVAGC